MAMHTEPLWLFVLPQENAEQAAVMRGITVYGARSLVEVAAHLNGIEPLAQTACQVPQRSSERHKFPTYGLVAVVPAQMGITVVERSYL